MANQAAAIAGSGDTPVVFTYSFDIGNPVAGLLTLPKWDTETYIVGDRLTWNESLAIAEEVGGCEIKTTHDLLEALEAGKPTKLPAHQDLYSKLSKETVQSIVGAFSQLRAQGHCNFQADNYLHDQFPQIKTRKVRELVMKAWRGK